MRKAVVAILLAGWASAASAADKIAFGPAPAWVKPVALPAGDGKDKEAAVSLLLQDQQARVGPAGSTIYVETAYRIQTPQGLAAGNVTLAWRPETDAVTVHKLQIRRGDQIIDVLAGGQTFTVMRRETNLDSATLDGVLTGVLQPEGLQVGDIIDFAISVASSDPVLKGHSELGGGDWNGMPLQRAHLRVEWPSSLPMRVRIADGLPAAKPVKAGASTMLELAADNLEPIPAPKRAPARFHIARVVEMTDFADWGSLATLFAPLYDKASVIAPGGPLAAEAAKIKAASADPVARAEAALALVQDRVRYVALAMGQGGLVPADADTSWSRRFGDCKAKTALLLGLLRGFGIEAEPVLVNALGGDGMDARLPMVGMFNHVLVRARIGGRTYWLDGTRTGDRKLAAIRTPAFRWGLPLLAHGAALVPIMPAPLETPDTVVTLKLDASAGLTVPAPATGELVLRGDAATGTRLSLANLGPEARERMLRDYWHGQYDFITVKTVAAAYDAETGSERLTMTGDAKMDWSYNRYETDGTGVGYRADFSRDPGPHRDAPYAVGFPEYSKLVETIILPKGSKGFGFGSVSEVNETVAGIEYRRHAHLDDNVFTIERSERSVAFEVPASEAEKAQVRLRALAEQRVYLTKAANYRNTDAEVAALLAATPTSASDFMERGLALMGRSKYDEAIAAFDKVVAAEPKNAFGFADRGLARIWKGDLAAGRKDVDAALAIDPRNAVAFRARGLAEMRDGKLPDAIAAYTKAIELDPADLWALTQRAYAYRSLNDSEHALTDSAAILARTPGDADIHLLRANIYRADGKEALALKEAEAIAAAGTGNAYAHVVAGRIYGVFGKRAEALREMDRALAIKQEAFIYLNRAEVRPKADMAARMGDFDAALKLDPKNDDALAMKARLLSEAKDHPRAIALWSDAIAAAPENVGHRVGRGVAYARAGMTELADKDFAAARAKATSATLLNNLCWTKAINNVALASALADCDAALQKDPEGAAYLDSRGMVLLRLGRLDEAIAAYDRALAKRPSQAASLYGRAIAWAKKGVKDKSAADAAAALRADPDVKDEFEGYGLSL